MSLLKRLDRGDIAYITFPDEIPEGVDSRQVRTVRIEAIKACELDMAAHEAVSIAVVRPPKKLTRNRHRV